MRFNNVIIVLLLIAIGIILFANTAICDNKYAYNFPNIQSWSTGNNGGGATAQWDSGNSYDVGTGSISFNFGTQYTACWAISPTLDLTNASTISFNYYQNNANWGNYYMVFYLYWGNGTETHWILPHNSESYYTYTYTLNQSQKTTGMKIWFISNSAGTLTGCVGHLDNVFINGTIPMSYYVLGQVKDNNNNALIGANVSIWNNGTFIGNGISGANGNYTIIMPNNTAYNYSYTVTKSNYYSIIGSNSTILMPNNFYYYSVSDSYDTINFNMYPMIYAVNVYSQDSKNYTVLHNVKYYFTDNDLGYTTIVNVPATSTIFNFTCNHNYTVIASVNNYNNATTSLQVVNTNDIVMTLTLGINGNYEITGQVVSNTGYPQTNARVYLYYPNGTLCYSDITSGVGQYYMYTGTNAPTGLYSLVGQDLFHALNNTTMYINNPTDFNNLGYWSQQSQIFVISNFNIPLFPIGSNNINNTQYVTIVVKNSQNKNEYIDAYLTFRGNSGNVGGSFFTCAHTGTGTSFVLPYDTYLVTATADLYDGQSTYLTTPNVNNILTIYLTHNYSNSYYPTATPTINPTGTPKPSNSTTATYVVFVCVSVPNGFSNEGVSVNLSITDNAQTDITYTGTKTNSKGIATWTFNSYIPYAMYSVNIYKDYMYFNPFNNACYFFTDDANGWTYSSTYGYFYHVFNLKLEAGTYYLIGSVKDINGSVITQSNVQCWDSSNDLLYSVRYVDGYNGVYKVALAPTVSTGKCTLFASATGYTNQTFNFDYPLDFTGTYIEPSTGMKQRALYKDIILGVGSSSISYYYFDVWDITNNYAKITSGCHIDLKSLTNGNDYGVDINDQFTLAAIPNDKYAVYITKTGYNDYSGTLDLTNYGKEEIDFYITQIGFASLNPTVTPIPSNTSGNINGDLPNVLRFFYNQWGINEALAQQFTTALLIIFILAGICAGIGMIAGSTGLAGILGCIGGLAGILIVSLTGFIPFWFLFVLCLEIIAYLLYFNNSNGSNGSVEYDTE